MSRVALPKIATVIEERRDKIALDLDRAAEFRGKIDAAISSFNAEVAQITAVVDGLSDDQVRRINQRLNAAIERGLIVNIDAEQLQAVLVSDFSKQQIDIFVKAFVEQAKMLKKANKLMELAEKTGNDKFLVNAERARQQAALKMTKRFAKVERIAAKLGEWRSRAQALQGRRVITYHNSWPYFAHAFGIDIVGFLEPKPGVKP